MTPIHKLILEFWCVAGCSSPTFLERDANPRRTNTPMCGVTGLFSYTQHTHTPLKPLEPPEWAKLHRTRVRQYPHMASYGHP